MNLEELVNKLLKTYVEGEEYFDNLDLNIRSNNKYLDYMVKRVKDEEFDYIIVSGHFGKSNLSWEKIVKL